MRVYNSVDMESEVFAIHSRRSSSPESLASGRDVSDEVNEGTSKGKTPTSVQVLLMTGSEYTTEH